MSAVAAVASQEFGELAQVLRWDALIFRKYLLNSPLILHLISLFALYGHRFRPQILCEYAPQVE